MFSKKKIKPQIDKEQLELIQNAQRRVKQKRRLYIHFVLFLVGAILLVVANVGLGIGKDFKIFELDWFVMAILLWLFLFLYHILNVFIINKFMGKEWEKQQLDKLITKQQVRIEKIKKELKKEAPHIAESEVYNEELKARDRKQEITIIAAAGENDAIGKDNQLVWNLTDDMQRFKDLTSGHYIIMGRKTFESFPKPLPNRTHVVISRQEDYKVPEGVIKVNSLEEAIERAKNDSQPFIIGGGQIYEQSMAYADKIELTRVHADFEADTFFPKIDNSIWKEIANTFHKKDSNHEYEFSFITFIRK
ncbi:MAG: Pr2TM family membrane protein [Flavobacteriaceae bacterium]|nr:Pr2TM family membrane protein [Flavobacteriaceae bacterium]